MKRLLHIAQYKHIGFHSFLLYIAKTFNIHIVSQLIAINCSLAAS
jgi:hypothetical protein